MTSFTADNEAMRVRAGSSVRWPLTISSDQKEVSVHFDVAPNSDNAPEWNVFLNTGKDELWSNYYSKMDYKLSLPVADLNLEVQCPRGVRYDDFVDVTVTVDGGNPITFRATARQSILALKTQINQENSVAESIYLKVKDEVAHETEDDVNKNDIYAVLCPTTLKGYIFVEGMNTDRMREKPRDIRKARTFVDGEIGIDEIQHYLTPVSPVKGVTEGDLVELVNGPFKGEKARVQKIDEAKEEITVELIEAMVPIPVTVKGESIKVIGK